MSYATANSTHPVMINTINPVRWMRAVWAAYRDAKKLQSTEGHHLQDMGITRREADTAFYVRYNANRYYSRMR